MVPSRGFPWTISVRLYLVGHVRILLDSYMCGFTWSILGGDFTGGLSVRISLGEWLCGFTWLFTCVGCIVGHWFFVCSLVRVMVPSCDDSSFVSWSFRAIVITVLLL